MKLSPAKNVMNAYPEFFHFMDFVCDNVKHTGRPFCNYNSNIDAPSFNVLTFPFRKYELYRYFRANYSVISFQRFMYYVRAYAKVRFDIDNILTWKGYRFYFQFQLPPDNNFQTPKPKNPNLKMKSALTKLKRINWLRMITFTLLVIVPTLIIYFGLSIDSTILLGETIVIVALWLFIIIDTLLD